MANDHALTALTEGTIQWIPTAGPVAALIPGVTKGRLLELAAASAGCTPGTVFTFAGPDAFRWTRGGRYWHLRPGIDIGLLPEAAAEPPPHVRRPQVGDVYRHSPTDSDWRLGRHDRVEQRWECTRVGGPRDGERGRLYDAYLPGHPDAAFVFIGTPAVCVPPILAAGGGKCPTCGLAVEPDCVHLCGTAKDELYRAVKAQYDVNRGRLLTMEQGRGIAALSLPPPREPYVCAVSDEDCLGVPVG